MLWHVSKMLMTDFKARTPSRLNGFYLICKTLLLYVCTCPYDESLESHVEEQNWGEGTKKQPCCSFGFVPCPIHSVPLNLLLRTASFLARDRLGFSSCF